MKRGPILLMLLCMIIIVNGCTFILHRPLQPLSETEIWEQVHKNTGSISDFNCEAQLILESGIRRIPVNAELYYRYPDWITIRTFAPFGFKIIEASLQKNRFQVYSLISNEYITGNLDSVDISSRFGLKLPNIDFRKAWKRLFNPDRPYNTPAEIKRVGKYYVLSYFQDEFINKIWVDGRKMLIDRENTLDQDGILIYYMSYSQYKKKSGVRFPRHIEFGDIHRGVKLTIDTIKFNVNTDFSDANMMISIPANAIRKDL